MKSFSKNLVAFCRCWLFIMAMAFTSSAFIPAPVIADEQTTEPTLAERSDIVKSYLKMEGYSPQEINESVIVFKKEGSSYIIFMAEDDAGYFRVMFPNFYTVDLNKNLAKLYEVEKQVNDSLKVVRVSHDDDGELSASVELFCSDTKEFVRVITRSITACGLARLKFVGEAEKIDLK